MKHFNASKEILLIEEKMKEIMGILGIQENEDNKDTPLRIAKMYCNEVFANRDFNYSEIMSEMTKFRNKPTAQGVIQKQIVIRGIKFSSMCSHHWLPYTGYVDIYYTPKNYILGLSKFPRLVKYLSKRPTIQEGLTNDIGEFIVNLLDPKDLEVVVRDVKHSCVEARGVEAECTVDTTYSYKESVKYEA